jgi:hypothetical protein
LPSKAANLELVDASTAPPPMPPLARAQLGLVFHSHDGRRGCRLAAAARRKHAAPLGYSAEYIFGTAAYDARVKRDSEWAGESWDPIFGTSDLATWALPVLGAQAIHAKYTYGTEAYDERVKREWEGGRPMAAAVCAECGERSEAGMQGKHGEVYCFRCCAWTGDDKLDTVLEIMEDYGCDEGCHESDDGWALLNAVDTLLRPVGARPEHGHTQAQYRAREAAVAAAGGVAVLVAALRLATTGQTGDGYSVAMTCCEVLEQLVRPRGSV